MDYLLWGVSVAHSAIGYKQWGEQQVSEQAMVEREASVPWNWISLFYGGRGSKKVCARNGLNEGQIGQS